MEIELALNLFGPLLCTVPVYQPTKTQFWIKDREVDELKGYHTLILVGYSRDSKSYTLRNLIGLDYGDFGFVQVSSDSIQKYGFKVILCLDMTSKVHLNDEKCVGQLSIDLANKLDNNTDQEFQKLRLQIQSLQSQLQNSEISNITRLIQQQINPNDSNKSPNIINSSLEASNETFLTF